MIDPNPTETGGGALVVGFLLVVLLLYRNPVAGLNAATVSVQSVLYFLVLPVVGILGGSYTYTDGRYSGVSLFLFGSYLGVFGLAVTLGSVLASGWIELSLWIGIGLLACSVTALAASVNRLVSLVRFEDVTSSG
jgi:hypothetical protein